MQGKKPFGDFIQQKRKEAGLTQKGFAEKLFVTESAVSKWERGVSYPDISLIKDICEILGVSEHELLTASEDTQTRANERLAAKYMRLTRRYKIGQMVLYGVALVVCFICNLAVGHTLDWFFIVLASLMVAASLTLVPVLVKKQAGPVVLASFTASLLLLLFVCALYTGGGWFWMAVVPVVFGLCVCFLPGVLASLALPGPFGRHKALLCMAADTLLLFAVLAVSSWYSGGGWFLRTGVPMAAFWLVIPWGLLLVIRYTKINGFFKASACIGLSGGVLVAAQWFTDWLLGLERQDFWFNLLNWNQYTLDGNIKVIFLLVTAVLVVAFALAGIVASLRRREGARHVKG